MRYADTPTVEVETYIEAAPEEVWKLVTNIHLIAEVSPELQSVRWSGDATEPAVGNEFVGRSFHEAIGEWSTTSHVIECEQASVFAWSVGYADNPSATWRFTLRPEGAGTRLSQWAQLGPGPSALRDAIERMPDKEERIVARRLKEFRTAMELNLAAFKEMSESAAR